MTFQKGKSGNPKGRPIGSLSLVDILRKKLQAVEPGCDNTKAEQIVDEYLKAVVTSENLKKDIFDRIDGKPTQALEMTGKDGEPIEHSLTVTIVNAQHRDTRGA